MNFNGIKYSNTTGIFYTFKRGKLYKLQGYKLYEKSELLSKITYEDKIDRIQWVQSDYSDIEGNSKNWVEPTEQQFEEFKLISKLSIV